MSAHVQMANWISLHRRLTLPCFPDAEAGPAAIAGNSPAQMHWFPGYVKALEQGDDDCSCLGARRGVRQSVTVLSPWIPGMVELSSDIDWRLWEGGALPKVEADVVIVCRPLEILPRMKLRQAPRYLIEAAFGGGAVYSVAEVAAMLDAHETANRRRRRAAQS